VPSTAEKPASLERWKWLWDSVAVKESDEWVLATWKEVTDAYGEPGRFYHTLDHISQCLGAYDVFLAHDHDKEKMLLSPRDRFAVELAIWLHDVVYDPRRKGNELASFYFAQRLCHDFRERRLHAYYDWGAIENIIRRAILSTEDHRDLGGFMTKIVLDVDLSILGQLPADFELYEKQIRKEYGFVPLDVFCIERAKILRQLTTGHPIYKTDFFENLHGKQARENIHKSLELLDKKQPPSFLS
jgi:predicted metal-dependent HD superfamily phosphohydrolase